MGYHWNIPKRHVAIKRGKDYQNRLTSIKNTHRYSLTLLSMRTKYPIILFVISDIVEAANDNGQELPLLRFYNLWYNTAIPAQAWQNPSITCFNSVVKLQDPHRSKSKWSHRRRKSRNRPKLTCTTGCIRAYHIVAVDIGCFACCYRVSIFSNTRKPTKTAGLSLWRFQAAPVLRPAKLTAVRRRSVWLLGPTFIRLGSAHRFRRGQAHIILPYLTCLHSRTASIDNAYNLKWFFSLGECRISLRCFEIGKSANAKMRKGDANHKRLQYRGKDVSETEESESSLAWQTLGCR